MKVLIVDDEKNSREVLKEIFINFFPSYNIIGEASDVEQAKIIIEEQKPDLVLLDIEMPKGNGFSLLRQFENIPFFVIFITGFQHYAIEAIRSNALDYLLKPVDIKELREALQKAQQAYLEKKSQEIKIIRLLNHADLDAQEPRISVHEHDKVRFLHLKDILYLEGEINYTHIISTGNQKFTSSKTVKEFEEFLSPYPRFLRIHRKHIINLEHVEFYTKGDIFTLTLSNGVKLEASRRKKQQVLAILTGNNRNI
jgi:two-component system LytT family response regulator